MLYFYKAKIDEVVDGDTYEATVDLGFNTFKKVTLRLANFDTPETYRAGDFEERVGNIVTNHVKKLIEDKTVYINTREKGNFGRWIAHIYLGQDGKPKNNLGLILEDNNFAIQQGEEWTKEKLRKAVEK